MMSSVPEPAADTAIAWRPGEAHLSRSRLLRLIERTRSGSYPGLLARIASDPEWYWREALADLDLSWQQPWERVWDLSRGRMWPRWFPGARFNYVASALDRHLDGPLRDRQAVIWEGDDGETRTLTFADLGEMTNRAAQALRALGVGKGDRVGIFLPMLPETVAAVLACGKLGAIYVPLFSGFGEDAIVSRLEDADATILITADAARRRGTTLQMKAVADRAMVRLPHLRRCLVVRRTGIEVEMAPERDLWWHEALANASPAPITEDTAADDPVMILYTSGTTGKPKGALHIHAGFPIKAAHDLAYVFDLHDDDVLFWLTDLGWMMGPWLICGGLILGATIVLFEGTPDHPGPDRLWRIVERHRVTTLGLAPTVIRALMPHGEDPVRGTDLSSLRILGSTGETWNPGPWRWYFDHVGGGARPIINYSGGTETSGGIVGGFPCLPVKPCSFTGPVPGMVADVVDDAGRPVRGGVGELVLREPWVGMTNGFWKANDRYEETYWSRFPDIWVHGDFAEVDDDGFWFIRGRSDDTLNVAGKRVGPAELESAAVAHGTVREAAAINVPHPVKGDAIVVFAVPRDETCPPELAEEVRRFIGERLGAALRPERVVLVADLPRTRNAKIMRRVIRAAWLGIGAGDLTALENPAAVDAIRTLGEASHRVG
ncbi:MAG TPA: AMP-binding protein [Thermomicrobiales bacterium]|nr:AMP-binding protein [Thermomicrobiales bacterium]